ncbi:MAG: Abortive infection protein [Ilumatobacteraceae bacterium]|nr:Abortive infection protein [Ilumatobacteraceae bacterium]
MSLHSPTAGSTTADQREGPSFGLPDAFVGWVGAYLFATVLGGIVLTVGGYTTKAAIEDAPLGWTMAAAIWIWVAFVALAIWVGDHKGGGWRRAFHVSIRLRDVPLGIAAGLVGQFILVNAIAWPILKLSGESAEDLARPAQELADKAHGAGGALLFLLIVGVVAPVAEELFFRGLVFRAVEKKWDQWWALGLSSAFFGLIHFQPLQFLPLCAAGALFGYLVIRTGRLGPAIVAHMAFNISTVVVLLWVS